LNIKVVTSVHNRYESKSFLKDWYNSFLLKGDAIIFNSNFVKKTYEHKFNDKTKLHVIPRGVDTNYFSPSRKKLTSKNIFLPSRISSWKGHELLLNYFSLLQQKHKDTFNIHIVSLNKSKEEKKIQLLINKLNISKKIIIHKPTLDVKKLYQEAYLVVNISKRPEGFGRTVSEALSVSKVVIAPPFTAISTFSDHSDFDYLDISSQNIHWDDQGAFTAEISPKMLLEHGV